jgi:hypothetical protein
LIHVSDPQVINGSIVNLTLKHVVAFARTADGNYEPMNVLAGHGVSELPLGREYEVCLWDEEAGVVLAKHRAADTPDRAA